MCPPEALSQTRVIDPCHEDRRAVQIARCLPLRWEIVPAVDCAVPVELRSRGGGETRSVLLLALLFGVSAPQQECSCIAFHSDHTSPQTSGCSLLYLCAFLCPCLFLPLTCLPFLPLSPYTASIFIGASPIDLGSLGCHDRLDTG